MQAPHVAFPSSPPTHHLCSRFCCLWLLRVLALHTHTPLLLLRRYYVLRHSLHPLKDVGLLCFRGECDDLSDARDCWVITE